MMKLIELAVTMALDAKVTRCVLSFVWILYLQFKRRIVIPPKERSDKDAKYAGAYKEPIPRSMSNV